MGPSNHQDDAMYGITLPSFNTQKYDNPHVLSSVFVNQPEQLYNGILKVFCFQSVLSFSRSITYVYIGRLYGIHIWCLRIRSLSNSLVA